MDAGATQVGNFSKQVWVLSGERHQGRGPFRLTLSKSGLDGLGRSVVASD